MAKKLSGWKTKGMNRDLSVSAFNPEFAFENINLRLATNDGNTTLSWVNEKGTAALLGIDNNALSLNGTCVGTAVLNQYLVLFLTKGTDPDNPDTIYRLQYTDPGKTHLEAVQLFGGNLKLSVENPLETLVSYESENIQKVYWTDGINQPRLINIAPDNDSKINSYTDTSFDFITTLKLNEDIKVQKILGGGGMFAPGVIQYAFTYYNKYGQESNIFYTTPLYYISHQDRGGSPEDKIDNAFKISFDGVDKDFDYLRIYSIQRTSINGTPMCKRIQDINISSMEDGIKIGDTQYKKASYTDTGTNGDSIDPTELLYKGGNVIYVGTMEQKDNTLFMGDITTPNNELPNIKPVAPETEKITLTVGDRTFFPQIVSGDNYEYANQLTSLKAVKEVEQKVVDGKTVDEVIYRKTNETVPCAGFKYGDFYRCGIQFQDATGKWTDPIFIDDIEIKTLDGGADIHPNTNTNVQDEDNYNMVINVKVDNKSGNPITIMPEAHIVIDLGEIQATQQESEQEETRRLDDGGGGGSVAKAQILTVTLGTKESADSDPISFISDTIEAGQFKEYNGSVVQYGTMYYGKKFCTDETALKKVGMGVNCELTDSNGNTNTLIIKKNAEWDDGGTPYLPSYGPQNHTYTFTCNESPSPEPVPSDDFEELLESFNTVLVTLGKTKVSSSTPNTLAYLRAAYTMADEEWNLGSSGLFNSSNFPEIYSYRGSNNKNYDLAYTAMQSWLMAMCLSEIVPTGETTILGTVTNGQTELYKKAYDLGNGRNVAIYGNYTLQGDLMAARLVAGAIYAINRHDYTFSDIDGMRTELGGHTISWSNISSNWKALGYSSVEHFGYAIATNDIFPAAAGPYSQDYPRTETQHPSEQGQTGTNLFYGDSGNPYVWYNQNYQVDVAVDDEVLSSYNLAPGESNYWERTAQAVADDSESTYHRLGEKTYYYYNASASTEVDEKSVPGPRFTFAAGSGDPGGYMGYIKGTFNSDVTGIDVSGQLSDSSGNETAFKKFMDAVRDIGNKARSQLYNAQLGRRRPAQGPNERTARESYGGNNYNRNWLDDDSISRLIGSGTVYDAEGSAHSWYIDKNHNKQWDSGEPYYGDNITGEGFRTIYPSSTVESTTYPSGHSAGVWSTALLLMQILPNKASKIFKAAYAYSVSRTIVRAHWNSDVMYGRLIGSMSVPLLNALENITDSSTNYRTAFQNAWDIFGGESPTPPGPTPGDSVKYNLINGFDKEIRLSGEAKIFVSDAPNNWDVFYELNANLHATTGPDDNWIYNDIIIPVNGSVQITISEITYLMTHRDGTSVIEAQYIGKDFADGNWYILGSNYGYFHPIALYTRIWNTEKDKNDKSNHMYWQSAPLQNEKLRKTTYNVIIDQINSEATLQIAETGEGQTGHYVILDYMQTGLVVVR